MSTAEESPAVRIIGYALAAICVFLFVGSGALVAYLATHVTVLPKNTRVENPAAESYAWIKTVTSMIDASTRFGDALYQSELDVEFALSSRPCMQVPAELFDASVLKPLESRNTDYLLLQKRPSVFCPQHYRLHLCELSIYANNTIVHLYNIANVTRIGTPLYLSSQSIMFESADHPEIQKRGYVQGRFLNPRYPILEFDYINRTSGASETLRLTGALAVHALDCIELLQGATESLFTRFTLDGTTRLDQR